jgi:hypothetical protein
MTFFAFYCIGMQKMSSFSLTGKIGAPPRRAATFVSENEIVFPIPNFKEIGN